MSVFKADFFTRIILTEVKEEPASKKTSINTCFNSDDVDCIL